MLRPTTPQSCTQDGGKLSKGGRGSGGGGTNSATRLKRARDAASSTPGFDSGGDTYKGIAVTPQAAVRIAAMKVLAAIPRGLVARASALAAVASHRGAGSDAVESARAAAVVAAVPVTALLRRELGRRSSKEQLASAVLSPSGGSAPRPRRAPTDAESTDAAAVRAAAAVAGLRLAAAGGGALDARTVSAALWVALCSAGRDDVPAVADAVVRVAARFLRTPTLPLRYIALLALGAADARASARRVARDALGASLVAFRRLAVVATEAAASSGSAPPLPPYSLLPEYALPYVVYVLAGGAGGGGPTLPDADAAAAWFRRGDAGGGDAAAGQWGPFGAVHAPALAALIDAVLASVAGASGSAAAAAAAPAPPLTQVTAGCLSLLFAVAARLRECEDAADAASSSSSGTAAIRMVCDLAFRVLKSRAKDQAAFAAYPGEVRVPIHLFRARTGSTTGVDNAASEVQRPTRRVNVAGGTPSSAALAASGGSPSRSPTRTGASAACSSTTAAAVARLAAAAVSAASAATGPAPRPAARAAARR